jgi:ketosteroid isomerase-like protein
VPPPLWARSSPGLDEDSSEGGIGTTRTELEQQSEPATESLDRLGCCPRRYAAAIDDAQLVRAVNDAFYHAFETHNLDALSDLWERSERAMCTHPGWATLRGWGPIASSFVALFQSGQALQFILTDYHIEVVGDVAWVSVDENLLGDQAGATVAALNLFTRTRDGQWRMVGHHGSPVNATRP